MPFYRYVCAKEDGKRVKGLLEAPNFDKAKYQLQQQDICILSLTLSRWGTKKTRLSQVQLAQFLSQLSSLLKAGMPLYESLCEIAKGHLQESYYPTLVGLFEHIQQGASLAEAMQHYPTSFSKLVIASIESGQAAGRLSETLENLAIILQKQQKRSKQFFTALLYPLILLGFSSVLILTLLMYVIPSLEMLFEERSVNTLTRSVIHLSHFLHQNLFYLLGVFICCGWLLQRFFKSKKGKLVLEKQLLRLPIIRPLMLKRDLGRFSNLMQVMLEGGVPLLKAMEIARSSLQIESLKEVLISAEQTIIEGKLLSQQLKHCSLIPPLFSRLLSIGEEGGNSAEMFGRISKLYETEVDKVLGRLTVLAQPILLLVMGAIVGVIMLAVLLPLTDINAFI